MNPFKKLLGDTGIYGGTTIIGRFLNWLLVPLYTNIFSAEEYGIVVYLMAATAIAQVVLTYGTETGFFRFASDSTIKNKAFSTLICSLLFTSTIFLVFIFIYAMDLSNMMDISGKESYLKWLALTLFFDVLCSIPFAKLRLENKAIKFGLIKIVNILFNIGINLFFLVLCPHLHSENPDLWILKIYNPNLRIGYIFISYLIAACVTFLILLPEFFQFRYSFDKKLLRRILNFSTPILIVSLAGMVNTQIDKNLMPHLLAEKASTGIYGANYKLGVIMMLFISAFRYAYEPFFFSQKKTAASKEIYSKVLTYFVVLGILVFLGVMFYIDIVKFFIGTGFHGGLKIVPFILLAFLFQGIYYTLSLWYKLSDKTIYGAYMSVGGVLITISMNILLVPVVGYIGAAYAFLACFVAMTIVSYLLGQRFYPISYDLQSIIFYFVVGGFLFILSIIVNPENIYIRLLINTILLFMFITIFYIKEIRKKHLKNLNK